jgi:hypothetical protein
VSDYAHQKRLAQLEIAAARSNQASDIVDFLPTAISLTCFVNTICAGKFATVI